MTRKSLTKQARELGDPLSETLQLKTIRDLESKLSLSEANRKSAAAKLAQAEQELRSAEDRLGILLETQDKVTAKKIKATKGKPSGQATAVICANDWHAEENVDPRSVDGANEFNLDVAARRINRTWERSLRLLTFARGLSNIRELVLWLGGDLINGAIHEEAEESNFLGPTEAILWVQDQVATGINTLLSEADVDRITVVTNYGNHGRSTRKRRISTGYRHSWEYLCFHNLAGYYRNEPNIQFKIEQGYHNWLTIQGHDVRFHHGDAVRFGGGVGGVHIPLRKKLAQWDKRRAAKLDVLGHFHQYGDDWRYTLCGCLVGYNAYAQEIGAEYQEPTQTFITIDKAHGKVMCLPVYCEASK